MQSCFLRTYPSEVAVKLVEMTVTEGTGRTPTTYLIKVKGLERTDSNFERHSTMGQMLSQYCRVQRNHL